MFILCKEGFDFVEPHLGSKFGGDGGNEPAERAIIQGETVNLRVAFSVKEYMY